MSFETPEYTANADAIGTLRLLEAIRIVGLEKGPRAFYQASTSELYGPWCRRLPPARDEPPFYPRSPYAAAQAVRLLDHGELPRGLRHARVPTASCFNHESPLRGGDLRHPQDHPCGGGHQAGLSRTSCSWATWTPSATGVMRVSMCAGMWLMTQQETADDYVLATGETHPGARLRPPMPSPRSASSWPGAGWAWRRRAPAHGPAGSMWRSTPRYFRPTEVELLIGDPTKARGEAGLGARDQVAGPCAREIGGRPT